MPPDFLFVGQMWPGSMLVEVQWMQKASPPSSAVGKLAYSTQKVLVLNWSNRCAVPMRENHNFKEKLSIFVFIKKFLGFYNSKIRKTYIGWIKQNMSVI